MGLGNSGKVVYIISQRKVEAHIGLKQIAAFRECNHGNVAGLVKYI